MNLLAVAAITLLSASGVMAAAIPPGSFAYVSNPTGGSSFVFANYTLGSRFTVGAQPLVVTSVGYWDAGNNGLLESHAVGIWDSSHTLLAFTSVPAGTGATLTNGFRWQDLSTPLTLSPNTSYLLGGFTGVQPVNGDPIQYGPTSYTVDSHFVLNNAALQPSPGGLQEPLLSGDFALGPNLMAGPVPEPSTAALLLLSAAGIFGVYRSRNPVNVRPSRR